MNTRFLFLIISVLSLKISPVMADSPLTSTRFHWPYSEENIINMAGRGILTSQIAEYLASDENPADIKMAVINWLGWERADNSRSQDFLRLLCKRKGYSDMNDLMINGNSHEILCMAYLMVMDNYFGVEDASQLAEAAVKKNPTSYTCNIIYALIKSQDALYNLDWCEVWCLTDRVRQNRALIIDMKPEAIEIIFNYMDQYREFCIKGKAWQINPHGS